MSDTEDPLELQPFDSTPANKESIGDFIEDVEDLIKQMVSLSIAASKYPHVSSSPYGMAVWNLANGHAQAAADQLKLAWYDAPSMADISIAEDEEDE